MQIKHTQKSIRMSPRKVRMVVNAVKKLSPKKALEVLPYMEKIAALPVQKTLKAAVANAQTKGITNIDSLKISEIQVGEGSTLKRGRAVSRGRWHPVLKRTSQIRIILETKEVKAKPKKKVRKVSKKKGSKKK